MSDRRIFLNCALFLASFNTHGYTITMTDTRKITGPMRVWVDSQIEAGRFADENQAIEAGLIALADRDAKTSNLKMLIEQGLDDVKAGRVYEYESAEDAIADIMGSDL